MLSGEGFAGEGEGFAGVSPGFGGKLNRETLS
jgi:hypothetical protein